MLSLFFAISLLSYWAYHDAGILVRDSVSRQFRITLNEIEHDMEQRQEKLQAIAADVAELPQLGAVMTGNAPPTQWDEVKNHMRRVFAYTPAISRETGSLLVFDARGDAVLSLHSPDTAPALPPGTSIQALSGKPVLYASVPVVHDGRTVGTCVATMNMRELQQMLTSRFVDNNDMWIALVDDSGTILLSTSPHLHPGELYNIDNSRSRNIIEEQKTLMPLDNNERLGMSTRIPDHNLVILISDDRDRLLSPTDSLWISVLVYGGFLAVFSLVIVYWYTSHIIQRAEKAQERYAETVDMAELSTWEWNINDNMQHLNGYFCAMLGLENKPAAFPVTDYKTMVHPDDQIRINRNSVRRNNDDDAGRLSWELRIRHKDGHWHWVECTGSVAEWTRDGMPARCSGIAIDIHDKKIREVFASEYRSRLESEVNSRTQTIRQSEAALRYERALLQSVLNTIPDIIYFRDMNKGLLGANRAFFEFFGTTIDLARGKKTYDPVFAEGLNDDSLRMVNEQDDQVLSTGISLEIEEILPLATGQYMYFETSKSLMVDEEGNSIGLLGLSRDITARKRSERELERAREEALAASRAKSEFLANMSHEIRTPLNGILGLNHLALQQNPPESLRRYLVSVDISARNLLSIVNDILDFSKIEAGRLQLERVPFRLEDTVRSAVDMMRPQAEKKGIGLYLEVLDAVPTGIEGDSLRFGQVLLNLLSNAIKFTEKGQVTLRLWADKAENDLVPLNVTVEDSGIGLSDEQINRLFSPFSQADSSITRKYGGTGLGLVITRSLVECMGGKLTLKSAVGVGSCFQFRLPVTPVELNLPVGNDSIGMDVDKPLEGKHVLLAEDNEINQLVAVELLASLGCAVDVANDGVEAVAMVKAHPYDAVLMDIQMPNMDGYTATEILRKHGYTAAIIAMTANAMQEDRMKTKAAGMQAHIAKPIDPAVLREVLVNCLA